MKIENELLKKIAYYSLMVWCGLPILIMTMNPIIKGTATVYFYMFMICIGIIGIVNGCIYFNNNKDKIKNLKFYNKVPFILLLLFMLWTFISCILAQDKGASLIGTGYRHDGFLSYICYAGFFINGLIISDNKDCIRRCFRILIISSTILSLGVLIGKNIFITGSNNYFPSINAAIFSNENHFAYYLTITIIASLFFTIYESKYYSISFILISLVLIKNDTFGSYLAVLITIILIFIYLFIKKEKRILISLLFYIFGIISIFSPNVIKNFMSITTEIIKVYENRDNLNSDIYIENNNADVEVISRISEDTHNASYLLICAGNSRLDLWTNGLKLTNKKPLFGYGLENLASSYHDLLVCYKTDRPHNTFIQILMTTGYIGFTFWISFLLIFFYKLLRNLKKINKYIVMGYGMIICYLISSFFGNTMYYTTPYFILVLGITSSIFFENEKDQ